ncbi:MAG: Ig-like domain-containing protein, partial [Dokdonella sp.]
GGASFQNGDGARSNTVSVGVDAPLGKSGWGIAGLAEHVNASGGIDAQDDDRFSLFLRYEFGRHGSFVPTSQLEGPAWIARSLARDSTAHPRTVETYRVRRSQTTSVTRSPKEYTNLFPLARDDAASVSSGSSISIDVLANDNDPEGAALSLLSVSAPTSGTAVIAGNQVVYTSAAGFSGVDTFRYTVSDGQGGTASALVTVTVAAQINHPPVIRDDSANVLFGQSVAVNVLANDTDPDGDALSVVEVGTPSHGSVSLSGNVVTYTAASGYSGPDSFTYKASDGRGAEGTATVRITVAMQPNQNPIANDDAATTTGAPVVINVLANDSDPDGDPLSLVNVTTPVNGGTVVVSGNAVTYSPPTGFVGTDRFSYTISDGRGGTATAIVSITVAMQPNQNPIANDDTAVTTGAPVVINVLANDSDPDGDPLSIVSVTTPVAGGTVVINGNAVTYTPSPSFLGTDRFSYTISDGRGGTATAMVTVTIAPAPNQPPVAVPDTYTMPVGAPSIVLPVLANDSDPDGDPLTIIAVTQPPVSGGTVAISGAGQTLTFTRQTTLPTTFTYTISDGQGHTATAQVTIN